MIEYHWNEEYPLVKGYIIIASFKAECSIYTGHCFSFYIQFMEESKRKEIREYLETQVNPIIRPLVEEIVRKKPSNIPAFIN